MEEDNQLGFEFPGLGRRKIEANFAGGQVSSDGGVMLLRQVDRWLGFTKQLDRILPERRNPLLIQHSQESLLRQRIYGLISTHFHPSPLTFSARTSSFSLVS